MKAYFIYRLIIDHAVTFRGHIRVLYADDYHVTTCVETFIQIAAAQCGFFRFGVTNRK